MNRNNKKTFSPFLLVLGAVLIVLAAYLLYSTIKNVDGRLQVEATITNVEKTQDDAGKDVYSVSVKFTVNGKEYTGTIDEYIYGMKKDSLVNLLYNPENPAEFEYGTINYFPAIIFMIIGLFVVALGVFPLIGEPYKKKIKRLKAQSRPIEATIKEYVVSHSKSGGKYSATLVCGDYQGKTYRTKIKVDNPSSFYVGSRINVYIDRENPEKYIIDTDDYINKRR